MKAITIKQPWASLIVHGIKNIENRTWPCPKKYLGQRVLIHSSGKPLNYDNFYDSILTNEQLLALPENKEWKDFNNVRYRKRLYFIGGQICENPGKRVSPLVRNFTE